MMKRKTIKFLISGVIVCGIGTALLAPTLVFGQDFGLVKSAEQAGYTATGRAKNIAQLVGFIIAAVLSIVGVIFLITIVYGGLLWMLSEGEEKKISKARGFIFYSIAGLIIILSAYSITYFILSRLVPATVGT